MYLSLSGRFTYKNLPNGYLGLRSANVRFDFGRVALSAFCIVLLKEVFGWYFILADADELNREIKILVSWLSSIEFKDNP